jgi:hypothetical protein
MVICCKKHKLNFVREKEKLTPGSALTFKAGGWFEVFEATFDLLPRKGMYKLSITFESKVK